MWPGSLSVACSALSQSCPTLAPQPFHQVVPPNSLMYYLHSLQSAEKRVSLFGKSDDLLTSSCDSDFTLQDLLTPSSTDNPSQLAPDLRKLNFTLPKPSPTVDVPRLLLCVEFRGPVESDSNALLSLALICMVSQPSSACCLHHVVSGAGRE